MSEEVDTSDIANATSASTTTFLTALVFNAALFGIQLGLFTILRPLFKAVYEPRTYVPPPEKRIAPLTPSGDGKGSRALSSIFWPFAVLSADYRGIIKANGLDAYFFVRFLRLMIKVLLPIWILSWVILLPTTSVNIIRDVGSEDDADESTANDGLARFTFGNVGNAQQQRYWAHLVCAWAFTIWILYNIKREMSLFIVTRQQHLIEKTHARSVQAHTILVTGIPDSYLSQKRLRQLFEDLPGGVRKIWINRDLKELPEIYDRRVDACNKLESAQTALLKTAAQNKLKADKLKAKGSVPAQDPVTPVDSNIKKTSTGPDGSGESLMIDGALTPSDSEEDFVPREQRPTHKLGFLGLFGEKVDTIEWALKEIAECNELLAAGREKIRTADEAEGVFDQDDILGGSVVDEHGNPISMSSSKSNTFTDGGLLNVSGVAKDVSGKLVGGVKGAVGGVKGAGGAVVSGVKDVGGKLATTFGKDKEGEYEPLNSAFIAFNSQISAHLAVQVLSHHKPYRMSSRYVEVAPSDVIWSNLGLNPYEQKIRMAISYAATAGLILLWAFPVAFVGAVSNVRTLCSDVSWLNWICDLPEVIVGIISGILPPVLLAVLMMLLPIILRLLARLEGIPKYTGLELSLMSRFFLFQVVHSFLVVTLSSGLIAAAPELIQNPTSIPSILAMNLPKASTFFLTYVILQGLAGAAGGFLQIVSLIIYYVKLFILGSTARAVHGIKYTPGNVAWGTLFPGITLLTVITLGYSVIAPIINGLSILTFFLFYQLYKYLFLWVYQQDLRADTGGLFFPKAIQHIFVGLYIEEVCLAALFFLARDDSTPPKASSIPQGALMIVLIVFTAGFHIIINNSYGPLLVALPLSLKDKIGKHLDVEEEGGSEGAVEQVDNKDDFKQEATDKKPAPAPLQLDDPESGIPSEERERIRQGLVITEETRAEGSAAVTTRSEDRAAVKQAQAEENELEKYGFAHPAASRPQRTIWIPTDQLGLSAIEIARTRKAGVDISARDATMDAQGKVDVSGAPPGYSGM